MFNTFTEGTFSNVNDVSLLKWNRFIASTKNALSNEDCKLDNGIPTFDAYDKAGNLHAWYHDSNIDVMSVEFNNAWQAWTNKAYKEIELSESHYIQMLTFINQAENSPYWTDDDDIALYKTLDNDNVILVAEYGKDILTVYNDLDYLLEMIEEAEQTDQTLVDSIFDDLPIIELFLCTETDNGNDELVLALSAIDKSLPMQKMVNAIAQCYHDAYSQTVE